jgi:phosphoribosylformylglycinamidine synthase
MPETLFSLVKSPYRANPNNSVIAFKDNSSAIRGFEVTPLLPNTPGSPGPLKLQTRTWDLLLTAETHNFPCAVAPFPGAETGAGGRIRDTHATGAGSMMGVSTAGYCVGNLHLPGQQVWWLCQMRLFLLYVYHMQSRGWPSPANRCPMSRMCTAPLVKLLGSEQVRKL